VAERVGVSNAYISALESGRKPAPPYAVVSAMAAALTVDEESLWSVARVERENHLKQRIAGRPAALRIRYRQETEVATQPARTTQPSPLESELAAAFEALCALATTTEDRRRLIEALRLLVNALEQRE